MKRVYVLRQNQGKSFGPAYRHAASAVDTSAPRATGMMCRGSQAACHTPQRRLQICLITANCHYTSNSMFFGDFGCDSGVFPKPRAQCTPSPAPTVGTQRRQGQHLCRQDGGGAAPQPPIPLTTYEQGWLPGSPSAPSAPHSSDDSCPGPAPGEPLSPPLL